MITISLKRIIIECKNFEELSEKLDELRKNNHLCSSAEVRTNPDGTITAIAECIVVSSSDFYISVWNCQARLVYKGEIVEIPDNLWDLFERLVKQVVYKDNGGAINWSNAYYPRSQKSLEIFSKLAKALNLK